MLQQLRTSIPHISPDLQSLLQQIVEDVVYRMGCVGAMAATLEQGTALPVRAVCVNMPKTRLSQLEEIAGKRLLGDDAVVFLTNKRHAQNLSVRAVLSDSEEQALLSDELYDLLRPMVKRPFAALIQKELQIEQVVAVPFRLEHEVVGNLFAAASKPFTQQELDLLTALGHQAATLIQSQRDLAAMKALERVILRLQSKMTDETEVLQEVVDAVVQDLGYAGAIVATLEPGNALPVRAYCVDMAPQLLEQFESRVGISLRGSQAVVYLDDPYYAENLSVLAVKGVNGRPEPFLLTDSLHDLFRPVVPKAFADLVQKAMGFTQLVAVPFFLDGQAVGNLFVASRKDRFTEREIGTLTTFGQQAAVGIHNARSYKVAEERREIAQRFGRMAFSATAAVHVLRNHVGVVRNYMHLLQMLPNFPPEQHEEILKEIPTMLTRLNGMSSILDNLHEPWQQMTDNPVNVNDSIIRSLRQVFPDAVIDPEKEKFSTDVGITVHLYLAPDLPMIKTPLDMLTEAYRIIIKNGAEALEGNARSPRLWISSQKTGPMEVQVMIRDNGKGIKPEHLPYIFEMGWSTKKGKGMGFGLYWVSDYVDGFGGKIRVESVPDAGTAFYIDLPAMRNIDEFDD